MLSSTFKDLREYRAIAEKCLQDKEFYVDWMEADGARPGVDVIASSLEKVEKADGYVLVLGERYGTPIEDRDRNPDGLSTTHLEYRRALAAGIPVAVVILDKSCWPRLDREPDDLWNRRNAFEEEAKGGDLFGFVERHEDFTEHLLKAADGLHAAFSRPGAPDPKPAPEPEKPSTFQP